jgi:hypothetical protein
MTTLLLASDTFTDADSTLLTAHTPDTGGMNGGFDNMGLG